MIFVKDIEILEDVKHDLVLKSQAKMFDVTTRADEITVIDRNTNGGDKVFSRRTSRYKTKKVKTKEFVLFKKGFKFSFKKGLNIITGDNGSGKTSLFNMLKYKPFVEAWFSDEPVEEQERKHIANYFNNGLRKIQYVAQPENIVIGFDINKTAFLKDFEKDNLNQSTMSAENAAMFLDMVNFSNGENILIFLDSIKDLENSLIILDEPETSLSLKSIKKLISLLKKLEKQNNQVVVITHHPYLLLMKREIYDFDSKEWIKPSDYITQINIG